MTAALDAPLTQRDAELADVAQRCIMASLDHARAPKIVLVDQNDASATLEVPPQALRFFADILGAMARYETVSIIPQKKLMSTQEAANYLNVSRPFVVKQLAEKKMDFVQVGTHRRIEFQKLVAFRDGMKRTSAGALQELADQAQELGMGY